MGELVSLICEIKEGKKDKFYLLIEKMEPLIRKYIRLLYKDDKEDTRSELLTALWEAVINISYYENDGQIMVFFVEFKKTDILRCIRVAKSNMIMKSGVLMHI